MKQPVKVVMLPTEDKQSFIYKFDLDTLYYNSTLTECSRRSQNQHLYIIVSQDAEPIKEDDWCISFNSGSNGEHLLFKAVKNIVYHKTCRKIIATTDPKLTS